MKITKHISFFFEQGRIKYINNIINETNKYNYITDIFIHTNNPELVETSFLKYNNGLIKIIYHDLSYCHPFNLTWKCRDLLKKQKNDYDIFMYIEDDILVPNNTIKYWLKYSKKLIKNNYNLGFVRIEIKDDIEYITDLPNKQLYKIITLDNETYCVNNVNPYCAFWIYSKDEFNKFIDSPYYNFMTTKYYGEREQSAIGLHGLGFKWYKDTLIPLIDDKLIEHCKIYHMPNNYIGHSCHATIEFNKCIKDNHKG